MVLLTDTAAVHLVTPNGSMTKHYEAAARYQSTQPGLAKYIQERYGWSANAMKNVNWSAHGASLRRKIKRKTHYTKLVHGILPTCKNIHRSDPLRNKCPLCHTAVEDWNHILKCPHESRVTWRTQVVKTVAEKCDSLSTRPLLKAVLSDALMGWLQHATDDYSLNFRNYPADVHRLIQQQNELGWQQLFLGRFSNEWSDLQDNFYAQKAAENEHTKQKTKKQTGHRWQVALIGLLWDQWWVVWESRNKDLHGADARSRAQVETREVQRKLRELYDLKARLSTGVQALLFNDVTEHYDRPNWVNKNWIAIHEPVIKADLKRVATRIQAGTRSIRQFLISLTS